MAHAGLVRVLTLAITIPALALAFVVGSDFMPELDEGAFLVQTILPSEASLEEVDRLNHRVEDLFRSIPEVEDVVRRSGRAERTEDPMPHTISDVLVVLKNERSRTLDEIEEEMRERRRRTCPACRSSSRRLSACASMKDSAALPPIWRCASSAPASP